MSSKDQFYQKAIDAKDKKIAKLEKQLEISKSKEAVLCSDCRDKGYITKNACILCSHEKRIKARPSSFKPPMGRYDEVYCKGMMALDAQDTDDYGIEIELDNGTKKTILKNNLRECPKCGHISVRNKELCEGGGEVCITEGCDYWFCY